MEIALYRPEIPPNTGNIARLSVLTDSPLHIVGEPSFSLDEAAVRRAGLDYWHLLDLRRYADWAAFCQELSRRRVDGWQGRLFLFTRFATRIYTEPRYRRDDILLFGSESSGVPEEIVDELRSADPDSLLRIPVASERRSLNLANAASVALYEALRQLDFVGLERPGPSQ